MVNQVNPMVSLVPGTPLTFVAASKPRLAPEKSPPAERTELRSDGSGGSSSVVDEIDAEQAVKDLNDFLKQKGADLLQAKKTPGMSFSDLVFQVDKDTGTAVFKVVDVKTREVIRQVPSEEVLAMARKLRELSGNSDAAGILVDEEG